MKKMDVLVAGLAESLGKDTADLRLRVGLHSGSVTGVRQGDSIECLLSFCSLNLTCLFSFY